MLGSGFPTLLFFSQTAHVRSHMTFSREGCMQEVSLGLHLNGRELGLGRMGKGFN